MIVGEFDIGMTTSEAITACMEKAYVKHIDRANLVIIAKLNDGTEVYAPILYNCQHWLFQKDVTRFSAESARKYGYTVVPFGEAISLFSIMRESGDREYYYIGNNTLLSGPMPARVPLCWPFLPRDEYFVVSSDERLNYNRNRHYPYIDKSSPQQDPLALVTPTFVDYEGTTKSPGTHEVPSQTTENPGRVFRIKGSAPDRHFVVHQPYEMWSKERKYTGSFFPTPIICETKNRSSYALEKRVGIFIDSGRYIGITLDGIQYAITGWNFIPEKLFFHAKVSNDCMSVASCLHLISNGIMNRDYVDPGNTNELESDIVVFEIISNSLPKHSINLQSSVENTPIGYGELSSKGNNITRTRYKISSPIDYTKVWFSSLLISSNVFCLHNSNNYAFNSYLLTVINIYYHLSNMWFYSEPPPEYTDTKITTTISMDWQGHSYTEPILSRRCDAFRVRLSNISLQIPYWVGDLYEFKYREDLDDTKGVLVYQDDDHGHLMMYPQGYFTHRATLDNENGSTHNYTDDWVVDQALVYKWNGQEICREVRSGTSSASGTHTTGTDWTDWTGGSGTLTQSVTVTEIIWDTILPKYGFFVFWECEIFTDDEWGGAPSTATYKLYAWDNGTKTLLKTETTTVSKAAHERVLHPYYYRQRYSNLTGHDNHVAVKPSSAVDERVGCGIPRFQIKDQLGPYPILYTQDKNQIPQSVLDDWKDCEFNNVWLGINTALIPSTSMFAFYYREGELPYPLTFYNYIDPPSGVVAGKSNLDLSLNCNFGSLLKQPNQVFGQYFKHEESSEENWPISVGSVYTCPVSCIKGVTGNLFDFGIGLDKRSFGELLGEIYYANYAFDVEYYAGNSVELTRIKEAARIAVGADSQKKLRFWPQQT